MRPVPSVLALLAFTSCAAIARAPYAPLATERAIAVRFHAELAPGPARTTEPSNSGPSVVDRAPLAEEPAAAPEITMRCRFLRLDARAETELLGARRPDGRVLVRAAFDAAVERCRVEGECELITRPTLRVGNGQRGWIAVTSQTAFVRSFGLEAAGDALLGDPEVATTEEGLRLSALPRLANGGGAVELALELHASQLAGPIRDLTARLPGTTTDVVLQVPIAFEQALDASATLAPGEVLVLRGLVDEHGRPILACIECERTAPEAAAR